MRRNMILASFLFVLFGLTGIYAGDDDSLINREDSPIQFFGEYETGFFGVTGHTLQIGDSGTNFNYVTQGGQDILLPFERFTVGATLYDRHRISLLYQPLEVNTQVNFRDPVTIDDVTFASGTAMNLKYGFPFYRVSYSYDVIDDPDLVLGVGAALQIRDASIVFSSVDGEDLTVSQNVGPVPALHIYSRWELPSGINLSADITGLYASSAIINGASFEFEGSILDASLRMGYRLKHDMELFGNLRFLGGTATGTSEYDNSSWSESIEQYTSNNLGTVSATVGLTIR